MELALRSGATAGVALVTAGLIAVTPVASPALEELQERTVQLTAASPLADLTGNLSDLNVALSTILGDGGRDVILSLHSLLDGADNFLVVAPETIFVAAADTLVGQPLDPWWFSWGTNLVFLPGTLTELINELQSDIQNGQEYLSEGLGMVGQGVVNEGLYWAIGGLDDLILAAPQDLVVGALNVAWTSLGF